MSVDNVHSLFEPDPEVIRAHLERLFRRIPTEYPGGLVEIAWAETTGAVKNAELFETTRDGLDKAADAAVSRNLEQRNVYVGVNPRKPGTPSRRGSTDDVEIAFFQFAECDKPESVELLKQAPLPYTLTVITGRTPNPRPHAYWELTEPSWNMAAWTAQQTALRDHFKGDAVLDPPRILRLAGTVNYPAAHKVQRGYRTELVTLHTLYHGKEFAPVTQEALAAVYRPAGARPTERFDPETGEVFEESSGPYFDIHKGIDYKACIRGIDKGENLHTNARDLVAHMVGTGERSWVIRELLTRLLRPVSDGGTLGKIEHFISTAKRKYETPNVDDFSDPQINSNKSFTLIPVGLLKPGVRPPRDWLVPFRMMRRHVTMTTAAPGVGKSTLVIEEAISMASGMDFLGFGIKEPLRVAVINNEETRDELERRIEATCQHFDVPFEAIAGRLFLYSGMDAEKIILARLDRNKNVLPTIHVENLRKQVEELKLDVVILDPFVQMHYVTESSNDEISRAMVAMRSVGSGNYPAAIHIVHHNRKPAANNSHQAGDLNSARGASSMGGEAHFFFTLTDMSDSDGEKMNIPEDDRSSFLRLDDAKRKMAPVQGARWFQRYGEMMPYGLMGEEIGILIPYELETDKKVEVQVATTVLREVQNAWENGNPYSMSPRATTRYIIPMMMRELRMTRMAATNLMKDWVGNGVIMNDMRNTDTKMMGVKVVKWPG